MSEDLTLHELTGSPNSAKVRIALDVKGLEYERIPIELDQYPGDRGLTVEISGQPCLPVLKHGKTVIFDSRGILRYLDSNFRQTPQLFSCDQQELNEIEAWELFAQTETGQGIGAVFGQIMSGAPDANACEQASSQLNDVTARIEAALDGHEFLMGDRITAADIVCAPSIILSMLPEGAVDIGPIQAAFRQLLHLGEGRDRTRAWAQRVMMHDPVSRTWF